MPLPRFLLLMHSIKETAFNLTVFFGSHSIRGNWDGIDLSSEIYHYTQKTDNEM